MGEPVEEELLSMFLAAHPELPNPVTHLRLGQPRGYSGANRAPDDLRRLFLSTLPEADLVTLDTTGATIYEFAIWRPQNKLGQLLIYGKLLPETPGYFGLSEDQVRLVLVNAQADPRIKEIAAEMLVDYELFQPPEILAKVALRRGGS